MNDRHQEKPFLELEAAELLTVTHGRQMCK